MSATSLMMVTTTSTAAPTDNTFFDTEMEDALAKMHSEALQAQMAKQQAEANLIGEALGVVKSGSQTLTQVLTQDNHFQELHNNGRFWMTFVSVKDNFPLVVVSEVWEVLEIYKPLSVLTNKALMLKMSDVSAAYSAIPEDHPLKSDVQIVEAFLESNPTFVAAVPLSVQLQYPNFVGRALSRLPLWDKGVSDAIYEMMDAGLWNFKDVVLGWIQGGGDLHDRIPAHFSFDEQILSVLLQNKKPGEYQDTPIPEHLRSNKIFMMRMLAKNPTLLRQVGPALKGDMDLALTAIGQKDGVLALVIYDINFIPDGEGDVFSNRRNFWYKVAQVVREKLHEYDDFVPSIRRNGTAALDDDQSSEAMVALEKKTAEYVGLPPEQEVANLRLARENLAVAGIQWVDRSK